MFCSLYDNPSMTVQGPRRISFDF